MAHGMNDTRQRGETAA